MRAAQAVSPVNKTGAATTPEAQRCSCGWRTAGASVAFCLLTIVGLSLGLAISLKNSGNRASQPTAADQMIANHNITCEERLASVAPPSPAPPPQYLNLAKPIKILPIGDSITIGLFGSLVAQKRDGWDYVGPAGYNGWTIKQLNTVAENEMNKHSPDAVTLMAGTNDFFFLDNLPTYETDTTLGCDAIAGIQRMEKLLDTIFNASPTVAVMVSGVVYINEHLCSKYPEAPWNPPACPPDMLCNIKLYNALMPALVQKYADADRRIAFHDPNPECNFVEQDYASWGIHFSGSGYAKLASYFSAHLEALAGGGGR